MSAVVPLRVQPRARRDEIVGARDGRLLVRVTAPPLDGRANEAVCRLVAERLGVRKASVTIVRGERSRDKLARVEGADEAAVAAALGIP